MSEQNKRFEIRHHTLCHGWVNCWYETDENGKEVPSTYATREEAQKELDEYLADIQAEIDSGERDHEHGYDPDEYCICEVGED